MAVRDAADKDFARISAELAMVSEWVGTDSVWQCTWTTNLDARC